jgi:hypothetical protein
MKIPRKNDLLKLQEQYKTDRKIADALGGVPEYLVGYWRRKKGIPVYSSPKFTQKEIEDVWLRHGDDFKAGRELNLSKAAFYSWRRKYGIIEKPAHLVLEQLELRFGAGEDAGPLLNGERSKHPAPTTIKLWRRLAENSPKGELLPDWFLRDHKGTPSNGRLFQLYLGNSDPGKSAPPENIDPTISRPTGYHFVWGDRDYGRADWQLIEGRVIRPGETVSGDAADLGGLGGISALHLPESMAQPTGVCKVEFARQAGPRTDVEDRFLDFLLHHPPEEWRGCVLEFAGAIVERLTIDRKIKLAQLATQFGAVAALCPFDDLIRKHYPRNMKARFIKAFPDRGAVYDKEFLLESRLKDLHVGLYGGGWQAVPGTQAVGHYVHTIVIGPAALPYEIAYAAEALDGHRIPRSVSVLVLPISAGTVCDSQRHGWLEHLVTAGAMVVDPRLAGRIGLPALFGAPQGNVLFTRPPENPQALAAAGHRLWFAGIRTAAATAIRGKITLP